jgi:biotin--protein ligase
MLTLDRFSGTNLNRDEPSGPTNYREVVDALVEDEKQRIDFMKACLIKLGLEVSQQAEAVPSLSLLHFSAAEPGAVSELVQGWQEAGVVVKEDGRELIRGENETFILQSDSGDSWDMGAVNKALTEAAGDENQADPSEDRLVDYNSLPKRMVLHESTIPDSKQTPYFNHNAFFWNLKDYHGQHRESPHAFGKLLMYGEVVTSTNTMLDKNPSWLEYLPTGLVATATTQVAGRGRGSNVWVSPPGSMPFSFVLRHSLALSNSAPVVFVQYLAAMAVVKGIQGYDAGYEAMPIKLKWPNDIYALDPTRPASDKAYVKIGGILVNSSYAGGDYTLVTGIGLNVTNAAPTTSLSQLAAKANLPSLTVEKLLASILAQFEAMYTRFCRTGFDRHFEDMYYRNWLHMDQIVTLETEGGARARIKGITTDWGLLVAEELGWQDRPTGKKWSLQSDSNSFDFFRGLLRRKV